MDKKIEIQHGIEADQFLSSPTFIRAEASVRAAIVEKWATSPLRDIEGHHELRLMLKLLDDLIGNMKVAVINGQFATESLKIERTTAEKMRRAMTIL